MNKEENKVYFVLEYKEKFTNKEKSIIVKGESKEAIDAQTENFETKERLAGLYFAWAKAFVEGSKKSLIDMYIVSEESSLGKLLSSYITDNESSAIIDQSMIDEYEKEKELSPKMPIKLMVDREAEENPHINYAIDRTPIIQMPMRTRRR